MLAGGVCGEGRHRARHLRLADAGGRDDRGDRLGGLTGLVPSDPLLGVLLNALGFLDAAVRRLTWIRSSSRWISPDFRTYPPLCLGGVVATRRGRRGRAPPLGAEGAVGEFAGRPEREEPGSRRLGGEFARLAQLRATRARQPCSCAARAAASGRSRLSRILAGLLGGAALRRRPGGLMAALGAFAASDPLCGPWPPPGAVCGARPEPRAAGRGRTLRWSSPRGRAGGGRSAGPSDGWHVRGGGGGRTTPGGRIGELGKPAGRGGPATGGIWVVCAAGGRGARAAWSRGPALGPGSAGGGRTGNRGQLVRGRDLPPALEALALFLRRLWRLGGL